MSRWHDNWHEDRAVPTPEEQIERRFATVDKLGEWSGHDKPTLMDTAKRLNAIKGEYGLRGEDAAAQAGNGEFVAGKFKALGIDYLEVYALACEAGLQWADALIASLNEAGELDEDELRLKLLTEFGDTWIDGVLVGATHRKAVE